MRMKRIVKLALVVIPALLFVVTVGLSTMGCDDDSGGGTLDMSTPHDMAQHAG
jgi:hypothetical protein